MARTETRLRPTVLLACRSAALAAVLVAMAGSAAEAQIGGLLKKAKKQVEGTVAGSPAEAAVPFDEVILELTEARLAQLIAGFEAGRRVLDGTEGGPSLASLSVDRERAIEERVRLYEANSAEIERYERSTVRIRDCRDDAFASLERAQRERYNERVMSDPALQQVVTSLAQELAAATQAGDTAAMQRVHRRLQDAARIAASPSDSAAIDGRCGRMPVAPAVIARIESLSEREQSAAQTIRGMEERASREEARVSELQPRQLVMARERILLFLSARPERASRGFSPAERASLSSRRTELQRYF